VTLRPQLAEPGPQLLESGVSLATGQRRSLWEGREAVRGPGAASRKVVRKAPRAKRPRTRSVPRPAR
jgi:hypothetical protein